MVVPRDPRSKRKVWLIFAVLLGVPVLVIGYLFGTIRALMSADREPPVSETDAATFAPKLPNLDASASATYSNIYKYDYVGPELCSKCHARNYDLWRNHPHSKMNRNATASSVVGDFSGATFDYGDARAVFSMVHGEYTMTFFRKDKFVRQMKVTRVIGSRFVQMYVGVQTQGPEEAVNPVYTREDKLPFAFSIARKEWFPQTYDETIASPEHDAKGDLTPDYAFYEKPRGSVWKQVCIKCHNTYAYSSRLEVAPDGKLGGFPPADIKQKLPSTRAGALPELEPWELVTLGISCESCHFGGREHALGGASISFVPRSADLAFAKATPELIAGGRQNPYVINSICSQCHVSDPQGPIYPNGAASWNSREARDLAVGACASKIACTSCHNPHEAGPVVVGGPDQPRKVAACTQCHEKYRAPEAAAKHASHLSPSDGNGSSHTDSGAASQPQPRVLDGARSPNCLDCHMPKIVHGLSGTIRSHRISSPTDPKMIEGEYPNACNLCHLDRSTRWTLDALAAKWGRKVDVKVVSEDPLGPRWLAHREPVVRQVGASAYGRSPLGKAAFRSVVPILNDESPPARMFGVLAVEQILGRPIGVSEYTPWATPTIRAQQVNELLRKGN